jgi:hypothetical protein
MLPEPAIALFSALKLRRRKRIGVPYWRVAAKILPSASGWPDPSGLRHFMGQASWDACTDIHLNLGAVLRGGRRVWMAQVKAQVVNNRISVVLHFGKRSLRSAHVPRRVSPFGH